MLPPPSRLKLQVCVCVTVVCVHAHVFLRVFVCILLPPPADGRSTPSGSRGVGQPGRGSLPRQCCATARCPHLVPMCFKTNKRQSSSYQRPILSLLNSSSSSSSSSSSGGGSFTRHPLPCFHSSSTLIHRVHLRECSPSTYTFKRPGECTTLNSNSYRFKSWLDQNESV